MQKNAGYTMLELMVTFIVVGIFASLAYPNYTYTIEKTRASEGINILRSLRTAQISHKYENGAYTGDVDDLGVTITALNHFDPPFITGVPAAATDPVVEIDRSNGTYTLDILADGTIGCTGEAKFCDRIIF